MATGIVKHTFMREDMAIVNPLEYGAPLLQSTLQAAMVDHAGENYALMIPPGIWEIITTLTVPEQVNFIYAPGAYLRAQAGVFMTFNSGPSEIGGGTARQFWYADGLTTGHVRFGQIMGPGVLPEWWGVDPNGVIANNQLWVEVFNAATINVIHPVLLNGAYRLDDTTTPALTMINNLQLRGNMRRGNTLPADSQLEHSARFEYYGAGVAIEAVDIGSSHVNMVLENIYLQDMNNTGTYGLKLAMPQSLTMRNVFVRGFANGMTVNNLYYGRIEQLKLRGYRTTGFVGTHNINGVDIDVHCNSINEPNVTFHFALGIFEVGGSGGQCNNNRVFALIESASGQAARITRCRGGEYNLYIETAAVAAGTMAAQAVSIELSSGLFFNCFANVKSLYATGIILYSSEALSGYAANNRIVLTGRVIGATANELTVQAGPQYAIDTTGFSADAISHLGVGTVGQCLGDRYIASGHRRPAINEGRGSTAYLRNWKVGDIVESNQVIPGTFTRYRCMVAGNPGNWISETPRAGGVAKVANYSIEVDETGFCYTNTGATTVTQAPDGIVHIMLPPSTGADNIWRFKFVRTVDLPFRVRPAQNGVDTIRGASAINKYIELSTLGTCIELELMGGSVWELVSQRGTVTYQP